MEEKSKANHYYISLPSQKTEENIIDFEMKMLEQNQIRGLLPAAREYQDTEVKIYFDISGRQNLEQKYTWQKLTGREVKQILRTITKVATELEEYMLDYNHLNLMPEFMYGKLDPGDLCFCYEPWDSETFGERLRPLALWFLDHMDYREREEVIFSYEFQRFCEENDVSLALLGQFMAGKADGENRRSDRKLQSLQKTETAVEDTEKKIKLQPEIGEISREEEEAHSSFSWEDMFSDTVRKKNSGMKELLRRIFPAGGKRYPDFSSMGTLRFAEDETEYGRKTTRGRKNTRLNHEEDISQTGGIERNICEADDGAAGESGRSNQRGDAAGKNSESNQKGDDAGEIEKSYQGDGAAREAGEPYQKGVMRRGTVDFVKKSENQSVSNGDAMFSESGEEVGNESPVLGELISGEMPTVHIYGYPCFLGRDGDLTDCEIADESVSRIHVRLFQADGRIWVEDLRSENGTFLNGDRMLPNEPWVLRDGDELSIGNCLYRFRHYGQRET